MPKLEKIPAMLPNLHIRLSGSSTYVLGNGVTFEAPPVVLLGPTMSQYSIIMGTGLRIITTGFLPAGCTRLIGMPAHELTDQVIDATAIWGHPAIDRLLDQLQSECDQGAIGGHVEQFLIQTNHASSHASSIVDAIDHWLECSPHLDLAELRALLDVGERHMRRMVMASHGSSPKTLAMKYRALRAAAAIAEHGATALHQAMAPYTDQAHFIRDFRRFTGWTPGAFMTDNQNVASQTLAGRKRAGIIRPLALWS